ncbi:MAG: pyridoxamine 5'-phosphate oxidase family protein [Gammaproteobacteria bacterium]|nr:MAG: pyridoxamine 5'-phosphate oxidase family protein [Gammaproteobacteria bacterium]
MSKLPEAVNKAWDEKEDAIVLTTVDKEGVPNSIWATCVSKYDDETIVIADNYLDKTRENIKDGSKAAILFITKEGKSYQIKGTIEYHTGGAIFDDMKGWNPERHPGHAAVAVKVESVYSGSEKLV